MCDKPERICQYCKRVMTGEDYKRVQHSNPYTCIKALVADRDRLLTDMVKRDAEDLRPMEGLLDTTPHSQTEVEDGE